MPSATLNGHLHHWEDAGSGEPLVMVHGAASAGRQLAVHAAELSRTYRVVLPDLRGMGRSARVASVPPSAWVDDLRALVAHLGLSSVHLYGVSLGARIVLRTAIDHPAMVRTLALDAPIIANDPAGNAALNARLDLDALPPERQRQYLEYHGDDWKTVVASYFAIRNQPDLQAYLDLREPSKRVKVPTLIMRGDEREPVHPLGHAFELAQNIAGSWLWIRPGSPTTLINAAPQEAYAAIRRHTARTTQPATA